MIITDEVNNHLSAHLYMYFEFHLPPGVNEKRINLTSKALYHTVGSAFATDKMADKKKIEEESDRHKAS